MRLVGASTLYIALPFLLEALVTAVIGVALAAGALAAVMWFGVEERISQTLSFMPWIGLEDYTRAVDRDLDPRSAADPDPDTRTDPQIPQSLTSRLYGRGVHLSHSATPVLPRPAEGRHVRYFPSASRRRAPCRRLSRSLVVPLAVAALTMPIATQAIAPAVSSDADELREERKEVRAEIREAHQHAEESSAPGRPVRRGAEGRDGVAGRRPRGPRRRARRSCTPPATLDTQMQAQLVLAEAAAGPGAGRRGRRAAGARGPARGREGPGRVALPAGRPDAHLALGLPRRPGAVRPDPARGVRRQRLRQAERDLRRPDRGRGAAPGPQGRGQGGPRRGGRPARGGRRQPGRDADAHRAGGRGQAERDRARRRQRGGQARGPPGPQGRPADAGEAEARREADQEEDRGRRRGCRGRRRGRGQQRVHRRVGRLPRLPGRRVASPHRSATGSTPSTATTACTTASTSAPAAAPRCAPSRTARSSRRTTRRSTATGSTSASAGSTGNSLVAVYNHASSYRVGVGDKVTRGETVGYVGSTGWSTGCHLHFTILQDGDPVDPMGYL